MPEEHCSECYLCLVSSSYDTDTLLIISCFPLATHHGSLDNPSEKYSKHLLSVQLLSKANNKCFLSKTVYLYNIYFYVIICSCNITFWWDVFSFSQDQTHSGQWAAKSLRSEEKIPVWRGNGDSIIVSGDLYLLVQFVLSGTKHGLNV